jgi:hypothetical protein
VQLAVLGLCVADLLLRVCQPVLLERDQLSALRHRLLGLCRHADVVFRLRDWVLFGRSTGLYLHSVSRYVQGVHVGHAVH